MSRSFVYEPAWRVLVCVECGLCLLPCKDVWRRHLRAAPHRIYGPELKALVDLFETYDLVQPAEAALPSSQPCAPVPGLKSYAGYRCLLCDSGRTRSLRAARDHASRGHGKKPAECREGPTPLGVLYAADIVRGSNARSLLRGPADGCRFP